MDPIDNNEIPFSVKTDHFQLHKSMHETMPGEDTDQEAYLGNVLTMPRLEVEEIMNLENKILKRVDYIDDKKKIEIIKDLLYYDYPIKISYLQIRYYVSSQFDNKVDDSDLEYRIKKVLDPMSRLSIQLIG